MSTDRRKFIKEVSLLAGGVTCGILQVPGCTPVKYVTPQISADAMMVPKDQWGDSEFILIKSPRLPAPIYLRRDESGYLAVLLECTHKQCEVRATSKLLKCPCHGSVFNQRGEVVNGPAEKDLRTFQAWEENESIFIR